MHQAAKLQFERIAAEYARWRGVAEDERSPAPAWWWGPAMGALDETEVMSPQLCAGFELPASSSYGDASDLLMTALAGQTSLSWPDQFPRKFKQPGPAEKIAVGGAKRPDTTRPAVCPPTLIAHPPPSS